MQTLKSIYRLKKIIAVSCTFTSSGVHFAVCRLQRKGQKVDIEESCGFERMEDVHDYCARHVAYFVSLHVQGKGLLVKRIDNPQGDEWNEELIYGVFPNFSPQQYYYSMMEGANAFWITIVQCERIDQLVERMVRAGTIPVQVYVGPFVLDAVFSQLNMYGGKFEFAGHSIITNEEGNWMSYDYNEIYNAKFVAKITDRVVQQEDITPYAVAFNTLLQGIIPDYSLEVPRVKEYLVEALAKIRFQINGLLSIGVLFIVLLLNTVLFQHYYKENERLRLLTGMRQVNLNDQAQALQQIEEKEFLLKELGWSGGVSKAWLLDQIGLSLHDHRGISLTTIQINPEPTKKRGVTSGHTENNRHTIRMQGRCVSLDGLNAWVRQLSNLRWVERTQIARFTGSGQFEDITHQFTLEIRFDYAF